jgi:hypothetical protein
MFGTSLDTIFVLSMFCSLCPWAALRLRSASERVRPAESRAASCLGHAPEITNHHAQQENFRVCCMERILNNVIESVLGRQMLYGVAFIEDPLRPKGILTKSSYATIEILP